MATSSQIRNALIKRLLGKPNYEDPKRCELNAYILSKLNRWSAPKSVATWPKNAGNVRQQLLSDVYFRGLPKSFLAHPAKVVWGKTITTGQGYRVRKVRYEGFPGMWIPALLYEPTRIRGRVPVVLNSNGHDLAGK